LGRTTLLANAPGSGKDVVYVLLDELMKIKAKAINELDEFELEGLRELNELESMLVDSDFTLSSLVESLNWPLAQCSMFGVWGSRTEEGKMYSMRNLDWN
jgi:hypothetical protein